MILESLFFLGKHGAGFVGARWPGRWWRRRRWCCHDARRDRHQVSLHTTGLFGYLKFMMYDHATVLDLTGDEGADQEQVVWSQLRASGHSRVHHSQERNCKVSTHHCLFTSKVYISNLKTPHFSCSGVRTRAARTKCRWTWRTWSWTDRYRNTFASKPSERHGRWIVRCWSHFM